MNRFPNPVFYYLTYHYFLTYHSRYLGIRHRWIQATSEAVVATPTLIKVLL